MKIPPIPKSFTIGPHKWTVKILPENHMPREEDEPALLGLCAYQQNLILVQETSQYHSPTAQYHTFWHEYMHALLFAAGRGDLSRDENLVDLLGMLSAQAFATAKY